MTETTPTDDDRILNLLRNEGEFFSIPEIADSLSGLTASRTRTIVNRLVKEGHLIPGGTSSRNARCYGVPAFDMGARYTAYTLNGETCIPLGDNLTHVEVIELCRHRTGVVVDLIEN